MKQWCAQHKGLHGNVHEVTDHPVFGEPWHICRDCLKELLAHTITNTEPRRSGIYMANPHRTSGWIWLSQPSDIPPFC